jgi:hypothetical protein
MSVDGVESSHVRNRIDDALSAACSRQFAVVD